MSCDKVVWGSTGNHSIELQADFSTAGLLRTFKMPLCLETFERVILRRFTMLIFSVGLPSSEHSLANAELKEVFRIMLPGN